MSLFELNEEFMNNGYEKLVKYGIIRFVGKERFTITNEFNNFIQKDIILYRVNITYEDIIMSTDYLIDKWLEYIDVGISLGDRSLLKIIWCANTIVFVNTHPEIDFTKPFKDG